MLVDTDTLVTARTAVPQPDQFLVGCESYPDTQVEVTTYSVSAQSLVDRRFQISLED